MFLPNDDQVKMAAIESVYTEYMGKIKALYDEQNHIIDLFSNKLKEKKMDQLRTLINKN